MHGSGFEPGAISSNLDASHEQRSNDAAKVAELVDAPDLGSGAVRRESSSLSFRTSAGQVQAMALAVRANRRMLGLYEIARHRRPRQQNAEQDDRRVAIRFVPRGLENKCKRP